MQEQQDKEANRLNIKEYVQADIDSLKRKEAKSKKNRKEYKNMKLIKQE